MEVIDKLHLVSSLIVCTIIECIIICLVLYVPYSYNMNFSSLLLFKVLFSYLIMIVAVVWCEFCLFYALY